MIEKIKLFYSGELPLKIAFWIVWMFGGIIFLTLISALFLLIDFVFDNKVFSDHKMHDYILDVLSYVYLSVTSIGVWKCSKNTVSVYMKYIAKTIVVVFWSNLLLFIYEVF